MKLIKIEDYQLKISDEALLVKPFRRLWNMDRSQGKEQFYRQMSLIYFTYSPTSNYSYILDEKDRMQEAMEQEGITEVKFTPELKAAIEAYKKLTKTSSSELLADTRQIVGKLRDALKAIKFDPSSKDVVSDISAVTTIVGKIPKLVKELTEAERAVAKELAEQGSVRGGQELSVGDIWDESGI